MTYSTYVDGDRRADVIKLDNHWGCRLYKEMKVVKTEFYKGIVKHTQRAQQRTMY